MSKSKDPVIKQYYNESLKKIQGRMKSKDETYASDLNKYGKRMFKKFKGVYPFDKQPKVGAKRSYIFNLDKSNEPGSHWCAAYNDGHSLWIYDSFGRKVMRGRGNRVKYTDRNPEQKKKENNCGQRCLAWLDTVYKFGIERAKII